jgi:hypothetical protein
MRPGERAGQRELRTPQRACWSSAGAGSVRQGLAGPMTLFKECRTRGPQFRYNALPRPDKTPVKSRRRFTLRSRTIIELVAYETAVYARGRAWASIFQRFTRVGAHGRPCGLLHLLLQRPSSDAASPNGALGRIRDEVSLLADRPPA